MSGGIGLGVQAGKGRWSKQRSVAAKRDEILARVLVTAMTLNFAVLCGPHGEIEKKTWKTYNIPCEASLASFASSGTMLAAICMSDEESLSLTCRDFIHDSSRN